LGGTRARCGVLQVGTDNEIDDRLHARLISNTIKTFGLLM